MGKWYHFRSSNDHTHPSWLIKAACFNALRVLSISFGLHARDVDDVAGRNFISFLRQVIAKACESPSSDSTKTQLYQEQYEEWATLSFIRAITISKDMSTMLATPVWIDLLFRLAESKDKNVTVSLTTQILTLRLLGRVLPHADTTMFRPANVQERIFHLLGHSALMCRVDGSHFGDQGLLQKV